MSYAFHQMSIRSFIRDMVPHCYLPAIQRELVWGMQRIENLFDSITRAYPIGTLLLWSVRKPTINQYSFYELVRNFDAQAPHNKKANLDGLTECFGVLDGQQRTTALYLGMKGSFRDKLPRRWRKSPDAWVTKKLYLNLLHIPSPEMEEKRYEFRFLSDEHAKVVDDEHYWFRVGEILHCETDQELRDWRRTTPYSDSGVFEDNLGALWRAVEYPTGISYFLKSNQDLNDVLTLFVRLNMGGKPLSYSDLLLSLATATWKTDAREEVHSLVDLINRDCGAPFGFTKDFVLKTLLVLNDGDVRFRTENIRRKAELEDRWGAVKRALPVAVRLVASFGFDGNTLTAKNAVIPVAYYVDRRGRTKTFLTGKHFQEDRKAIRLWLIQVLVGRAFSGQSDRVLTSVRSVLKEASESDKFPAAGIMAELRRNQNVVFSRDAVEKLVDTASYGGVTAFQLLSLVSPIQLDPSVHYHVDHMHPKAHLTRRNCIECGVPEDEVEWVLARGDSLPNLQVLPGLINQSKLETPYGTWLQEQENPDFYRELGMVPLDVSLDLADFKAFHEGRRQLLIDRIADTMGLPLDGDDSPEDRSQ